jgi:hypothetical protein
MNPGKPFARSLLGRGEESDKLFISSDVHGIRNGAGPAKRFRTELTFLSLRAFPRMVPLNRVQRRWQTAIYF